MLFLCTSYNSNKAPKTSGTSLMTNGVHEYIMTIRFSLAQVCSNTVNHTTIASFWQLDFQVDLMDNLLFRYSSYGTWNVNCSVAGVVGSKAFAYTIHLFFLQWICMEICLSSSAKETSDTFVLGSPACSLTFWPRDAERTSRPQNVM